MSDEEHVTVIERPLDATIFQHPFRKFGKIPRWSRDIVISEKIDGTNGVVYISDDLQTIKAGSRSKWILPGKKDNFGFASWVILHCDDLLSLGPGYHYGEWFGKGINRGYDLPDKRFALFNTTRWRGPGLETKPDWEGRVFRQPMCCTNVPVLYEGPMSELAVLDAINDLTLNGSRISPGFMKPEGVVVFHTAGSVYFKKTIVDDDKPKGIQEE